MLSGLEEGGEDHGGGGQGQSSGDGAPAAGDTGTQGAAPGGLGQLGHWMALMAEHMTQDPARLQQFLWPKLLTGKYQGYYPRFYVPRIKFKEFYFLSCYYIIYLKDEKLRFGGL